MTLAAADHYSGCTTSGTDARVSMSRLKPKNENGGVSAPMRRVSAELTIYATAVGFAGAQVTLERFAEIVVEALRERTGLVASGQSPDDALFVTIEGVDVCVDHVAELDADVVVVTADVELGDAGR